MRIRLPFFLLAFVLCLPAYAQSVSERLESVMRVGWQIYDGKYNTTNKLFRCWLRRKKADGKYEYSRHEAATWDAAVLKAVDALAPIQPPTPDPPPPDPGPIPPIPVPSPTPASMQAVLQKLKADNHPWWNMIVEKTINSPYGDQGQWGVLAYIGSGDASYARKGVEKIKPYWTLVPRNLGGNFIREAFIDYALWRRWLDPVLTAEEKAAYNAMLIAWADYSIGRNEPLYSGGMPLGDSDQLMGQYFGLALVDATLGTNYLNATTEGQGYTNVKVGGLTPTNEGTARDAIASYAANSAGGLWITGTEYGEGELSLPLTAMIELERIHGRDYFPEITALKPALRKYQEADLVPDMTSQLKIGDVEHGRGINWIHKLPLMGLLNSGMIPQIVSKFGHTGYLSAEPYHRIFYGWDPAAANPVDTNPVTYASGMGVLIHNTPTALFTAHAPTRPNVHHEVGFHSDFRLWANGEWVIDHVLDYAGPATNGGAGNNSMLLAGLPSMYTRGPVAQGQGAGYSWLIGETKGEYMPPGSYLPPPSFVNSARRTTVYLEAEKAVVVRDAVDLSGDPKTMPLFDRYTALDQSLITSSPLQTWILHMPVAPMQNGSVWTWSTEKGQPVTLHALTGGTPQVVDEKVLWADAWVVPVAERKWHLKLTSNDLQKTWLNVVAVGNPAVTTVPGGVKVGTTTVTFGADGKPEVN